jgi:hypothetical protein
MCHGALEFAGNCIGVRRNNRGFRQEGFLCALYAPTLTPVRTANDDNAKSLAWPKP